MAHIENCAGVRQLFRVPLTPISQGVNNVFEAFLNIEACAYQDVERIGVPPQLKALLLFDWVPNKFPEDVRAEFGDLEKYFTLVILVKRYVRVKHEIIAEENIIAEGPVPLTGTRHVP